MKKLFPLILILVLAGAGCASNTKSRVADGGIFKTVDMGKQWSPASAVPTTKGIGTLATANILSLAMDPQDNNVLYAGTREDGFLYTDDAGYSWRQPRNKDLATGLINSIKINPKDVCTVFVAKGARLYKTTDCMRTFSSDTYVETRPNITIARIELDWFNPETIWVALSNGDIQKSMDGGKTWSTSTHVKDYVTNMMISNADSRVMLIGTAKAGIFKTTDSGTTWTHIESDAKVTGGLKTIYDLKQTESGDTVLTATQYGLLRSTDFGSTWSPIKLVTSSGQVVIRTVGIDQYNPMQIFYATPSTFYQSADGGVTWKTGKLPSQRTPYAMIVDPKKSSVIYIGEASDVK